MAVQSNVPETQFVKHGFDEVQVDLGEISMNYAQAGSSENPALLVIPGQSSSWWGYERAMPLLSEHFHVFAVDLRGQGRSTRTPGRYTLDNMGNDLVRFIDAVIAKPTFVSGNSSGGLLAAWLAAYGKPGTVTAVVCEDAPFFASEQDPAVKPGISDSIGDLFALWNRYLGDQWSIGDWNGLVAAMPRELPPNVLMAIGAMFPATEDLPAPDFSAGPPQNLLEYDPEWGRAFAGGTATQSCDQARLLGAVRCPLLLTQHFRRLDPETSRLSGALSDAQAERAIDLVNQAGQTGERQSFPTMAHAMHLYEPELYTRTVWEWAQRWM